MSFKNLSIRRKLTVLMMIISVFILLLVSSFYMLEEYHSSLTFLERELTAMGISIGKSCKNPLMQRRIPATVEILSSLEAQSNVRAAYLFDEGGAPVAEYIERGNNGFALKVIPLDFADMESQFWVNLPEPKISMSWTHFSLFLPIKHGPRQVGSLYLLSDLQDLYSRLNNVIFIVLSMSGLLLFLSWWLSGRLQRPVSVPLLNLVDTMGTITRDKDFSLRAQKQGQDEIGQLVDGFNRMLEQIEMHRQELVAHQQSLEITVERRTEELRQMVAVLEIAKQQAEAASEAKSHFLANITHELRTPLIGVLGMNELMFRTAMDEQQQMLATTVQSSGENLLTLINNVLDFSKIEAGKMQLEEQEFALYQTVDDVLQLLSGPADDKGISLYSEIPLTATCRVLGDDVRFRQIVMNLVGNAIKFTEQGSVTVRLACDSDTTATAAFTLEVTDTGIGMDKTALEQIFSAFHQADVSHTRKYGGTGLGLAIVQQLVGLLDGKMAVDSQVGQGSSFKLTFSLPLVAAGKFLLPENLQQQRVLLCCDDDGCRQLLTDRLAALSLEVVATATAADFWYQLNAAERQHLPFALVFLPLEMSLPEGLALYQAMRNEAAFNAVRRILLLKRHQSIVLQTQEQKLYLPVSWDVLHETLCRSWNKLHLVEPDSAPDEAIAEEVPVIKHKFLLAGGSLASRELMKVGLKSLAIEFDTAKSLPQLQAKLVDGDFVGVLIDGFELTTEDIAAISEKQQPGTLLLLVDAAENYERLGGEFVVLEKPVKQDRLRVEVERVLQAATVKSLTVTVSGDEAVHE